MSQRYYTVYAGIQPILEVMAGWDRPLQHHFLSVFKRPTAKGEAQELLYDNLDRPDPGMTPDTIEEILKTFGIPIPASFIKDLVFDEAENVGNLRQRYKGMQQPRGYLREKLLLRAWDIRAKETVKRDITLVLEALDKAEEMTEEPLQEEDVTN